jgi:hypothetical protein
MDAMPGPLSLLAIGETMVLVTPEVAEPLETATAFRLDIAGAESNVAEPSRPRRGAGRVGERRRATTRWAAAWSRRSTSAASTRRW